MILIPINQLYKYDILVCSVFEDTGFFYCTANVTIENNRVPIYFADTSGNLKKFKNLSNLVECLRKINIQRFECKLNFEDKKND